MKKLILIACLLGLVQWAHSQVQTFDTNGGIDYDNSRKDVKIGPYTSLGSTRMNNFSYFGFNAYLNSSSIAGAYNRFKPNYAGNGTTGGKGLLFHMAAGGNGDLNIMGINWNNDASEKDLSSFVPIMSLKHNQLVGIGTTSPQQMLHVLSTANDVALQVETIGNNVAGVELKTNSSTDWAITAGGTGATRANDFYIFDRGASVSRLLIDEAGYIGMGTDSPSERLEVNGNARVVGEIYSKKVKVTANASNWPDYVFSNNYELTPLSQLEAYIQTNKHLPEVPSAKEVAANGQDLGDIQATLLKKVEELTLYVIEQNKSQLSMKERLEKLEAENAKLKALLKQE